MAVHETYTCQDCLFEFTDGDENFFYKEDTHEIVEFVHLVSTAGSSRGSKIKGHIYESYCKHCDKFIKTFYITDVDCPLFSKDEIIDIVKSGIKKNLKKIKNETIIRNNELKEIRLRKKYEIEKRPNSFAKYLLKNSSDLSEEKRNEIIEKHSEICVSLVELEGCEFKADIQDFDSEKEAIEYCKRHAFGNFFDEIDRQISYNRNFFKRKLNYLYRVEYWDFEEYSDVTFINCPECGNEVYRFINADYPCPNCEGKLVITQTIYAD